METYTLEDGIKDACTNAASCRGMSFAVFETPGRIIVQDASLRRPSGAARMECIAQYWSDGADGTTVWIQLRRAGGQSEWREVTK